MTRRYLTPNELRLMLERQQGLCAAPGCMSEGPFEADHFACVALGNVEKPDQLLCVDCHRAKTKRDVKAIAKVKRIAGGRTQYDKRQERGSRLQSRGFDKSLSKKMDGSVVRK